MNISNKIISNISLLGIGLIGISNSIFYGNLISKSR